VGDTGGQRDQMVIGVPRGVQVLVCLRNPALSNLLSRVFLRIRKEPYKTEDKYMLPEEIRL
jgi:hypothetical protein